MAAKLTREQVHKNLRQLQEGWPNNLWIFATGNAFYLMRCGSDGERMMNESGGVDQDYIVNSYRIPSDGGDW